MTLIYWGEVVCFVADFSVGAFNDVLLFRQAIGMPHKPSPERLILPCGIFLILK